MSRLKLKSSIFDIEMVRQFRPRAQNEVCAHLWTKDILEEGDEEVEWGTI